jgi:uncharacterized protein (TIGR02466 family)|tara:strand:- start:2872 stop:3501 length:630 start_codon:yes stop_codon:yes gene_type:complete
MKYNLFDSYIWKSKIKYDKKDQLINNLLQDYFENKNKFTPHWECFIYSSFKHPEQNNIPEDLLDVIEEKILEYLKNCPKELQIKGTYILSDVWYNIYEKDYFQEPHNHGNALFSGCYYLKFNKKKHHQTTFYNPNYNLDYKKLEQNSYFCFEPDCDEDDIIIFPSSLKHGTMGLRDKNDDEIRITISFNITNPNICLNEKVQDKEVSYN